MSDTDLGAAIRSKADSLFDAAYFERGCGRPYRRDEHWLTFFGHVADLIVQEIQPQRVLDAGCALGLLVEALRERGVEAEGIDISSFAIANVSEPIRAFCRVGSIADEFPTSYDLITSIEVVEHMPAHEAEAAIANMCRHSDDVLFSSSPTDHREPTHVNVQPPEYWAEQFARHGFYRDVDFDGSFATTWAVRFRRTGDPLPRTIRNYERRYALLAAERNERRQFALEARRDLSIASAEIAKLSNEVAAVQSAFEKSRAELNEKNVELDAATNRETALRHDLERVQQSAREKEQNIFGRLRRWLKRPNPGR